MALMHPPLTLQQQSFVGGNANKPGSTGIGCISRSKIAPVLNEFQECGL
jgi:hypothetical protein